MLYGIHAQSLTTQVPRMLFSRIYTIRNVCILEGYFSYLTNEQLSDYAPVLITSSTIAKLSYRHATIPHYEKSKDEKKAGNLQQYSGCQ